MDLTPLTDSELADLFDEVLVEQRARSALERAPARSAQVCRDYLQARDRLEDEPAPWVEPTAAHDLYPTGHRVTHDGATWESARDANAEEPGTGDGWTEAV